MQEADAFDAGIPGPLVATFEPPVPVSPVSSGKALPCLESPKQSKQKHPKRDRFGSRIGPSKVVLPVPEGYFATAEAPDLRGSIDNKPTHCRNDTLLFTIKDIEEVLQNVDPVVVEDLMIDGISISRKRDRGSTDDELDDLYERMYDEIVTLRRTQKPRGVLQVSTPDLFCESWADATSGYAPTSSDKIGLLVRRPAVDGVDFPFGVRMSREGLEWHVTCKVAFQVRFCTGVKTKNTAMRLVLVRDGEDSPVDPLIFGKALLFKTPQGHFDAPLVDGVVEFRGIHFAPGVSSSVVTGSKSFRFMCTLLDPTSDLRAFTPRFQITSNPRSKAPFKEQDSVDATLLS